MSNTAKKIIIPKEADVFRTIFLYVGQGEATLLVIPDGKNFKYVLIDSNNDKSTGGVDLVKLLQDLFKDEDRKLDVYINTHPHKDHAGRLQDIYNNVGINQLWHSGHKPSKEHDEVFKELESVIKKLGSKNAFQLKGSTEENKLDGKIMKLGDINYNVLAPAEYIVDEIGDEKPTVRDSRIHEQCGVIRFRYGSNEKQILITGDADYKAWKDHITDYHKDRLPSTVLSAPHHGSNSFYYENSETQNEPYKKHLEKINPTYVIVSAPKSKESPHGHPDKEAMKLYREKVGEDYVFHLGNKRECVIVDISSDGDIDIYPDDELVEKYGKLDKANGSGGNKAISAAVITKIDNKPFGA